MSESFVDQLNRTPVTYGVLAAYLLLAWTTGIMNPDGEALYRYGAAMGFLVMDGEPWRLVTHCFLHGGLLHLALNSYALYLFGPVLEQHLGSLRFSILYVVAGIMGGVVAILWSGPQGMLVGGSGALFGMLGALLAINLRSGRNMMEAIQFQGTRQLIGMIVINLVIGWMFPFISNPAHIGGLLAGFVLTFMILERGRALADPLTRVLQAGWIALTLSLTAYVLMPVLRWDYQERAAMRAESRAERRMHRSMIPDDKRKIAREIGELRGWR